MSKPALTMAQLHALMAVVPRVPHHYALASDVMRLLKGVAASPEPAALRPLAGVEIREDTELPPGAWEARNRDGPRFDATPTEPRP